MTAYNFSEKPDVHMQRLSEQSKVSKAEKRKQIEDVWKRRGIIARRWYKKTQLRASGDVLKSY
jgi:hypothetical protein